MTALYLPLAQAYALDHGFRPARWNGPEGPVTWDLESGRGINLNTARALEARGLCSVQVWPKAWEATLTPAGLALREARAAATVQVAP